MSVKSAWRLGWGVLGSMGPRWAAYRALRSVELKLGVLERRAPCRSWDQVAVSALDLELFATRVQAPPAGEVSELLAETDALLEGRFRLFQGLEMNVGTLPDWHRNAVTSEQAPRDVHWSRIEEFRYGDVKAIWELGRARWAFLLARAHAHTGQARYADGFWRLFEHWCEHNPPNRGIHWRCGQEASLRLVACSFAASVLRDASATTRERRELFARFVRATAERVEAHLSYALSQRNNHGVSECVGLLTAATLLPEATEAKRWQTRALQRLQPQLDELVYADGGFAQHSLIYQRLMLQLMTWCHRLLLERTGNAPQWLSLALQRCHALLLVLADEATGQGPLFGPDDGTQLLPLQTAEYHDLRPALDAATATLARVGIEGRMGTRGEAFAWFASTGKQFASAKAATNALRLGESEPASGPGALQRLRVSHTEAWHAPRAGLLHWRNRELSLSLRCPTEFAHRPSQLDLLHVGLQCAGKHVVIDPGTFSYNTAGPFAEAFCSARVHSAPQLEGHEPAQRLSRFLFYPWPHGHARFDAENERFTASHSAFERQAVTFVRELTAPAQGEFEIVDRLYSEHARTLDVHWLLADVEWQAVLPQPAQKPPQADVRGGSGDRAGPKRGSYSAVFGAQRVSLAWSSSVPATKLSWVRADPTSDRGWYAPRYLQLAPARSMRLSFEVKGTVVVRTRFRSVSLAGDMVR